jgi:hypothetical protein
MASASSTIYPEDPTGSLASNLITGEVQSLSPVVSTSTKFRLIMPVYAPFFVGTDVLTITDITGTVTTLVSGKDYYPAYVFLSASRACAAPIAGGFVFTNNSLAGTLTLQYQTLGGNWTLDVNTLTEIVANASVNPITVSWEEITDLPDIFPPIAHIWDIDDMVGADDIITALDAITDAVLAGGQQGLAEHEADHNNPHVTTAAQVGAYTTAQSDANLAAASATLNAAIATVQTNLNAHEVNYANPHQTTSAQVGLGNVQNFGIAADADAVAGTSSTLYMTPRGVLVAMNAGPSSALNIHELNFGNPHQVSAAQVGLGNVNNYATATAAQTLAGTAANLFVTPSGLAYAISQGVQANLTAHTGNTGNPHQTTAAQVGLGNVQNYAVGQLADATAGTSNTLYMTPLLTATAINTIPSGPLTAHVNNTSNPHATTAAQVGAYSTTQIDSQMALKLNASAQAADSAMFNTQTPAQFTAAVLSGTAANATQFGGYTVAAFTTLVEGLTVANATAINGQTLANLDARYILPGKAAPQTTLSGLASSTGTATAIWSLLGTITLPASLTVVANQLPDMQWFVAGGDPQSGTESSLYFVRMATRGGSTSTFNMAHKSMGDYDAGATFGWTVSAGVLSIWMKTADSLANVSITDLHPGVATVSISSTVQTTAPTGITYSNP